MLLQRNIIQFLWGKWALSPGLNAMFWVWIDFCFHFLHQVHNWQCCLHFPFDLFVMNAFVWLSFSSSAFPLVSVVCSWCNIGVNSYHGVNKTNKFIFMSFVSPLKRIKHIDREFNGYIMWTTKRQAKCNVQWISFNLFEYIYIATNTASSWWYTL